MGEIITFYSYKGGVGRTMALANAAVLLTQWNYKVLIVDWDLEAPGLEFFFKEYLDLAAVSQNRGVIDLLYSAFENISPSQDAFHWQEFVIPITIPNFQQQLHLMTAGKRDESYFGKVRNLDLPEFYAEKNGGFFIEGLRKEWKQSYDYILVDSRTGITDIGGICTVQLPDILILLFTATAQSLQGIIDIFHKTNRARQGLPVDRFSLLSVPIPARFDSNEEFKISQEWLAQFERELSPIYSNWLPDSVNRRVFLEKTKIPYVPYFSFGEKLPVIEQGTTDSAGLGYVYETVAALLAHKLDDAERLIEDREQYVRSLLTLKDIPVEIQEETDETTLIEFVNRINEIAFITNIYCSPYLLISAPAGYGKSRLLQEVAQRLRAQNWYCLHVRLIRDQRYTIQELTTLFLQKAGIEGINPFDLSTPAKCGSILSKELISLCGHDQRNIVLLIDTAEALGEKSVRQLLNEFLATLRGGLNAAESPMSLRLICAGRQITNWKKWGDKLPLELLPLTPFNFQDVHEAVVKSDLINDIKMDTKYKKDFAAYLIYFTGGHPACMTDILSKNYGSTLGAFIANESTFYQKIVHPVIETIQDHIPAHLQRIFERLSVFRRYNLPLLQRILDHKLLNYEGSALALEGVLTSTYLVNRKYGFIQDDIVRRLFVIKLRKDNNNAFIVLCGRAQQIIEAYLQETTYQTHSIVLEALFHELQSRYYISGQTSQARQVLSEKFFAKNGILQKYLNILSKKPEAYDNLYNMMKILQDRTDWEFQFTLNFFLRTDEHYTDEPYQRLLGEIEQFSMKMQKGQ